MNRPDTPVLVLLAVCALGVVVCLLLGAPAVAVALFVALAALALVLGPKRP